MKILLILILFITCLKNPNQNENIGYNQNTLGTPDDFSSEDTIHRENGNKDDIIDENQNNKNFKHTDNKKNKNITNSIEIPSPNISKTKKKKNITNSIEIPSPNISKTKKKKNITGPIEIPSPNISKTKKKKNITDPIEIPSPSISKSSTKNNQDTKKNDTIELQENENENSELLNDSNLQNKNIDNTKNIILPKNKNIDPKYKQDKLKDDKSRNDNPKDDFNKKQIEYEKLKALEIKIYNQNTFQINEEYKKSIESSDQYYNKQIKELKIQEKKLDDNLSKHIKNDQLELDDMLSKLKSGNIDINKSKPVETNENSNADFTKKLFDIQEKISDLELTKKKKEYQLIEKRNEKINNETKRHNIELKKLLYESNN